MISFHLGLKRLSERPSSRRAADNCEEIASPHRLLLKQRVLFYHAAGCVHHGKFRLPMCAVGQERRFGYVGAMSASPPLATGSLRSG
jgi:hypothetical protein